MLTLLQQTAQELVKRASRTYKFEDLITFTTIPYKNLPEMLARYPNKGIGFKVWRKTWPTHKYIIIKEAEYKTLRNGKFFGLHYEQNKPVGTAPIKIRNCGKRGIWRYDTNGTSAVTENGLFYSADVIREYMELHSFQHGVQRHQEKPADEITPEVMQKKKLKRKEFEKKKAASKSPAKKEIKPLKKEAEKKKKEPAKEPKKEAAKEKKK